MEVGDEIEIEIDSLSYGGGRGVGRYQGIVFFIPFSAPGDRLRARVQFKKKKYAEAEVLEILKPSETRQTPPCPVFGVCGGCTLQHISYAEQLKEKQKYIERSLRAWPDLVRQILPSEKEFFYRNRVQLHRSKGGDRVGFLKRGSNQLVPIDRCWITDDKINKVIGDRTKWGTFSEDRFELALTKEGEVVLRGAKSHSEDNLFSQVNAEQNSKMISEVLSWAKKGHSKFQFDGFYDFYSGSGNLTFPLYEALNIPGVGVELSPSSIKRAKTLVQERNLDSKLSFECSDVESALLRLKSLENQLVVLDPPREGLTQVVIDQLSRLKPKALILVGCHLMNFARDLDRLREKNFVAEDIVSLDMFPQTDHVECLAYIPRRMT